MSRNFATEDMNILQPRIDRRNETDGITGSHFPLYEWLLALISKVFGFSEMLARVYSLLIFSFVMLAMYLVLLQLKIKPFAAVCSALLLLSVPQMYYDSINAMPDILALCFSLFALHFFLSYFLRAHAGFLFPAILFAVLGGLIKFQFLIIPASSIAYIHFNRKQLFYAFVSIIFIVLPIFCWYSYAIQLTQVHNLKEFGLWIQPITWLQKWQTLWNNLISDLPELLLGWPLFVFLIVFISLNIKSFNRSRDQVFLWLWLLGFIVFYCVAIERMMHHSYYFMAIIPACMIVCARCIQNQKQFKTILVSLVLLNFMWSFARIIPSRWAENKMNVPSTFLDKNLRQELTSAIPEGASCVVGPDVSGCIYFYFTNTKGFSFERPDELLQMKVDGQYFEVMRHYGVKYLICNQGERMRPVLEKLDKIRLKNTIGDFQIWELL